MSNINSGLVIWFTGLSGSGKSTLSKKLSFIINKKYIKILDGDEIRKTLSSDLGFSRKDRSENIKRISYVVKCIADCCGIAIVAAISPYDEDRQRARKLIGENRFFEIFLECHIDILKERDVKGLYEKALSGEIKNFTGISDPYEIPENPNCIINTGELNIKESLNKIKNDLNNFLGKKKILNIIYKKKYNYD